MKVENIARASLAFAAASFAAHFAHSDKEVFQASHFIVAPILALLAVMTAVYGSLTADNETALLQAAVVAAILVLLMAGGFIGLHFLGQFILG